MYHSKLHTISSLSNEGSFPILCWSPQNNSNARVSVFLHGRNITGNLPYTEETLRKLYPWDEALQHFADCFHTHILIPYLGNWSHADPVLHPKIRRSTFLGEELPAWVREQFQPATQRSDWAILGFSMGGTGAINTLARYPETYALACNFGGNCDPAYYHRQGKKDSISESVFGPWPKNETEYRAWSTVAALERLGGRRDVGLAFGCGQVDERLSVHQSIWQLAARQSLLFTSCTYPGGHDHDATHMQLQLSLVHHLRNR